MMDNYWGQGSGDGIHAGGFIFMIFMVALIVIGLILVIRYAGQASASKQTHGTALNLLKKGYANGEINSMEYEEKLQVISNK